MPVMAKKPRKSDSQDRPTFPLEKRLASHQVLPYDSVTTIGGLRVELRKMQEIIDLLWLPSGLAQEDRDARIVRAMDLFQSLKPTDGIEAMLAEQMIGAHHAAQECLRRAGLENQSFEARNQALDHAKKMMALYVNQMAALDKHRGKGQQQVTVKHVHVGAGGQAIVGDVNAAAALPQPIAAQAALSAPVEPILPPVISTLERARVPRP